MHVFFITRQLSYFTADTADKRDTAQGTAAKDNAQRSEKFLQGGGYTDVTDPACPTPP